MIESVVDFNSAPHERCEQLACGSRARALPGEASVNIGRGGKIASFLLFLQYYALMMAAGEVALTLTPMTDFCCAVASLWWNWEENFRAQSSGVSNFCMFLSRCTICIVGTDCLRSRWRQAACLRCGYSVFKAGEGSSDSWKSKFYALPVTLHSTPKAWL